jgi:PPK2 family polyphosphate:nucleotide phosphotransferase
MNNIILKNKKIRVETGSKFKLRNFDPGYDAGYDNETTLKTALDKYKVKIAKLQDKLFANDKYSVLIVLQAFDAAGKDSCIKHVMSGINPQGCHVTSFKQPSKEELDHDFLWRTYKALPERGKIGVFNRSYYEEVLVTKVHPEFILGQRLPGVNTLNNIDQKFWKNRYKSINDMERHLVKNGTVIIKIFLNITKDEQKNRFLDRINDPDKNWKFSTDDLKERKLWTTYQTAFEEMIRETSTKHAPWHVVPSDNQWVSRAVVGDILLETLESLKLKYPVLSKVEKDLLLQGKTELEAEKI